MNERVEAAAAMGRVSPLQAATIRGQLIIEAENIGKRRQMYEREAAKTADAEIRLQSKLQAMRDAASGGSAGGDRGGIFGWLRSVDVPQTRR